ncbi:MAG: 2-amino-4-hydroxy-6-hydroxymethyldihydropteridine diphosphokinase [Alphaproteobacteria bacterium]|nr:2-amino-4-hydroxy-6-hydroxymethyldihydropteridine diphosphokinase [Alphaproteobacteria bacterium]
MNEVTFPVALGLGSNIGDRYAALRGAIEGLRPYIAIDALSPAYETAPAYVTDQPRFLNAALTGTTKLAPFALLRLVKDLESSLGRQPSFRNGPRMIDIDILFYGDETVHIPELTIPHASMAERDFVLCPLNDIAPQWRHPGTGATVAEMFARLAENSAVRMDEAL